MVVVVAVRTAQVVQVEEERMRTEGRSGCVREDVRKMLQLQLLECFDHRVEAACLQLRFDFAEESQRCRKREVGVCERVSVCECV